VTFAHIAGVPLEELLALAPSAGAFWVAFRARLGAGRGRGASSPGQ
jgi:hypothetical protein